MSIATDMLAFWSAAEIAVSQGQSIEHAGRKLTRADAAFVCERRDHWQRVVNAEAAAACGRDDRYSLADFS